MDVPEIIVTGDGSHSLFDRSRNETYHSVHGAIQESKHVFISAGLEHSLTVTGNSIDVLEIGFGTGLNVLLALLFSRQHSRQVNFTSIEAYPLPEQIWSKLNYAGQLGAAEDFVRIHSCSWENRHSLSDKFSLAKCHTTLESFTIPDDNFDVIFYDAFAPSRQPEMWHIALLEKVCAGLRSPGVFVTYCATGQLKRDLRSLGLNVETLAGPPGKKEMVRASK